LKNNSTCQRLLYSAIVWSQMMPVKRSVFAE